MGRRLLEVSGQVLVDMLKLDNGAVARFFRVADNPLPDDAKVVGYEILPHGGNTIFLVLESEGWWGDSRQPLADPTMVAYDMPLSELLQRNPYA